MTTQQVATRLNKSRRTIHRMAATGALPLAQKLPTARGAYLFDADVIDALAKESQR